ncbi:MAG: hypothetical protein M0Q95_20890 [Porticoccaceae bacterium]|nr:hypothetical protein [Porticoccaceae bacterium]
MPKPLDVNRLKQFENHPTIRDPLHAQQEAAPVERWPSREPIREGQISMRAPLDTINRFKQICKEDRRTYADMLTILMDLYERER